jgi:uncharacterized protein DUF4115
MDNVPNDKGSSSGRGSQDDTARQFALLLHGIKRILSEQAEAIERASAESDLPAGQSGDHAHQVAPGDLSGREDALASHLERGLEQLQREVGLLRSFRSGANGHKTLADSIANVESRIAGLDLTLQILSLRVEEQGSALSTRIDVKKRSQSLRPSIVLSSLLAALVAAGIALGSPATSEAIRSTASSSLQGIVAWTETLGRSDGTRRAGDDESAASGHRNVVPAVSAESAGTHDAVAASRTAAVAPIPTMDARAGEQSSARIDAPAVTASAASANSPPAPSAGRQETTTRSGSTAPLAAASAPTGSPPSASPATAVDLAKNPPEKTAPQRSETYLGDIDRNAVTSAGAAHLIREVHRDTEPTPVPRNAPQVISGRDQTEVASRSLADRSTPAGVPAEVSAKENGLPPAVSPAKSEPGAATHQEVANATSEPTLAHTATTVETASPAPVSPVLLGPMHAAGDSRIILHARANTWVEVREEHGRVLLSGILRQNETWPVPNRPELLLTTGNAGATELVVDGVIAPPLGAINGVRRNIPLTPELVKLRKPPADWVAGRNTR